WGAHVLVHRERVLRNVTATVAALAGLGLLAPVAAVAVDDDELTRPGESVLVDAERSTIAPGMELTTFSRLEDGGWNAGSILEVDLASGGELDYQYSGAVTETETVRATTERTGATAAINGDVYDINESNAPLGVGIDRAEGVVTSPVDGHANAVTVADDAAVRLAQVFIEGELAIDDGQTLDIAGVNNFSLPPDGIGVFTSAWGDYTRADTVQGDPVTAEVHIVDETVTQVGTDIGSGAIDGDTVVVVGRGAGAEALLALDEGHSAKVTYAPRSDFGEVAVAIGGNQVLIDDGEVQDYDDPTPHPRSAVGLSADGTRMFLVSIDGRQAHAHGMTLTETAEFMADLGAYDALNLDGGGSSTLVAREPATDERTVVNSPSDGSERPVANSLGLFAPEGSGELTGFLVQPRDEAADPDHAHRVFPGLTRDIDALGHDESYAPVDARPRWRTSDRRVATVARDGDGAIVTGVAPGRADISARLRGAEGDFAVTVLGELVRVEPNASLVPLGGADDTGRIDLTG